MLIGIITNVGYNVGYTLSLHGVSEKSSPPKTFWNIFTSVKSFCAKLLAIHIHILILIFHQMALIFPRVPIVFTLSIFQYSPIEWKCRGRSSTAWFTHNGWASVVDSIAAFLNSTQFSPFVRVTGNDWFCTKSSLTKRLHAQFVVVRQFSHW